VNRAQKLAGGIVLAALAVGGGIAGGVAVTSSPAPTAIVQKTDDATPTTTVPLPAPTTTVPAAAPAPVATLAPSPSTAAPSAPAPDQVTPTAPSVTTPAAASPDTTVPPVTTTTVCFSDPNSPVVTIVCG
jgi:hypothetical protein